eukprot:jgi/Mesvir1/20885/Mv07962-RA.1
MGSACVAGLRSTWQTAFATRKWCWCSSRGATWRRLRTTEDDNCAKEFGLAVLKGLKYIVPIVMEDALLDPKKWITGVVTMNIGTKIFVPMTKDSDISVDSAPMRKLLDILAGLGVKPRQ